VFERIPELIGDGKRAASLIDRLRRRTRNGDELFWLYWALERLAEEQDGTSNGAGEILGRFFDHMDAPTVEQFWSIQTKRDGKVEYWRPIPAGEGWIGSPEDEEGRFDWEGARRRLWVTRPFRMTSVPVTNALFALFDRASADESRPNHPVVVVSWYAAVSFCRWLSTCGELEGARLPSEEEWEYACRAGTATRFWKGDEDSALAEVAWLDENSGGKLHSVGEKPANPWGLYDVHGNVWEWTASPWKDDDSERGEGLRLDPSAVPADPAGGAPRDARVFRGGSCWDGAQGCRAASRLVRGPGLRLGVLGFRLLLPFAPSDLRS
ncbi:MAG: formylglycine-generating enzyme family protein, partial [Holophagales bacterium]|nr:formylglycine-generating enzyme family protein [Holophagales bacterium]